MRRQHIYEDTVMQSGRNGHLIQFGVFELKTDTGELRKHGIRVRLQGKPLQLLQALLEHPGDVVTREELRNRLWQVDTFVDFESGLNTAANRLRLALGDSAEHPRYIETLARSGYRFVAPVAEIGAPAPPAARPKWILPAVGLLVLAAAAAVFLLKPAIRPPPAYHQVTFRRMTIGSARFGPDGETVVYDARSRVGSRDLFVANTLSPESRPLGFPRSSLGSISSSGELALLTYEERPPFRTNLMRVPLNGGAPLALASGISGAAWAPDGTNMAVFRNGVFPAMLEYPRGKVVYRSSGWISDVHVSPSGRDVAFIDHTISGDDAGAIRFVGGNGASRALSAGWASAQGLAWAPSGREVWFTAARSGLNRALHAVDLSGKVRTIAAFPGTLVLHDINRGGRVLISREEIRLAMAGTLGGDTRQNDLSWFDWSRATGISEDGSVILFDETGEGGGAHHAVYMRRAGAANATRVGSGIARGISPDGKRALIMPDSDQTRLELVPLTPAQTRTLPGRGLIYDWAQFFPDGARLLVGANFPGKPMRLYIQPVDGGGPQPMNTSFYLTNPAISPDGKQIAGVDPERRLVIQPVEGGAPRVIPTAFSPLPLRWSASGRSILVQCSGPIPATIFRVNVADGRYTAWREIAPTDLIGVTTLGRVLVSKDENSLVYSFNRQLSELFVVDGWL